MPDWKRFRKPIVLAAAAMALVALYALLGFWVLPRVVRAKAIDYVAQTLHQELSIGQLRFNPFTFELDANDIAVRAHVPAAAGKPLLALGHAHVDFQLW